MATRSRPARPAGRLARARARTGMLLNDRGLPKSPLHWPWRLLAQVLACLGASLEWWAMGFALAQASLGGACDNFVSRPGLGGTATPACAHAGRAARALRPLPGESSAALAPEGLGGLARPWAVQHISLQACTGWQVRHAGGSRRFIAFGLPGRPRLNSDCGRPAARLGGSVLRRGSEAMQCNCQGTEMARRRVLLCFGSIWQSARRACTWAAARHSSRRVCGVCFQYCVYMFCLAACCVPCPSRPVAGRPRGVWCDVHVRCPFPLEVPDLSLLPAVLCGLAGLAAPSGDRRVVGDLCHVARPPSCMPCARARPVHGPLLFFLLWSSSLRPGQHCVRY